MIQIRVHRKPHLFVHFHVFRVVVLFELGVNKTQRRFVAGSVAFMPGPVHWKGTR